MDPLGTLLQKLKTLAHQFIEPGAQFSIYALACAFVIAVGYLYARQRRRRGNARVMMVIRAMFSRRVLFNQSTYADAGYLLINTLALGGLIAWAAISTTAVAGWVCGWLNLSLGAVQPTTLPDWLTRGGATILFFFAYEFGYYVDHALKHRVPFLWETHRPHHTAEVLTPLTAFRVHPLDSLIFGHVLALTGGVTAGVINFIAGKPVLELTLDGTNIVLVAFFYAYVHLQHSEVWIPFRGWLGRLFMSPAHHQIHHSADPTHYNKNLGSCLAIWDWLFGTLSIPEKESPRLKFGVHDAEPHRHAPSRLLLTPVLRVGKAFALMFIPAAAIRTGEAMDTSQQAQHTDEPQHQH